MNPLSLRTQLEKLTCRFRVHFAVSGSCASSWFVEDSTMQYVSKETPFSRVKHAWAVGEQSLAHGSGVGDCAMS